MIQHTSRSLPLPTCLQVYANGDSYEGLWNNGKAEGPGRYARWAVHQKMSRAWQLYPPLQRSAVLLRCTDTPAVARPCDDQVCLAQRQPVRWGVATGKDARAGHAEVGDRCVSEEQAGGCCRRLLQVDCLMLSCDVPRKQPCTALLPSSLPDPQHSCPGFQCLAGERYDGEWVEGQECGIGVFTWRDGSTYEGFWEGGKKAGVGVFRPAPNTPALPGNNLSAHLQPGQQQQGAVGDAPTPPRSPVVGSPTAADIPLDSPAADAISDRQFSAFAPGMIGRWLGQQRRLRLGFHHARVIRCCIHHFRHTCPVQTSGVAPGALAPT